MFFENCIKFLGSIQISSKRFKYKRLNKNAKHSGNEKVKRWLMTRFSRCAQLQQEVADAITPLTIPPPEDVDKPVLPKIEELPMEIPQLNLLEVSELS